MSEPYEFDINRDHVLVTMFIPQGVSAEMVFYIYQALRWLLYSWGITDSPRLGKSMIFIPGHQNKALVVFEPGLPALAEPNVEPEAEQEPEGEFDPNDLMEDGNGSSS